MTRRSTGGVVVDTRRKSPVFALRFRAYGHRQYVTLGNADDGWTRKKAEDKLRHVLADVEHGICHHTGTRSRPRSRRTTRRSTSSRRDG